ncbi:MAG: ParB/RepB/Spo0J family partition protein [Candidatus Omnitrophota bacterium]|nr:ParB/RepB/Spo0J family partition protein [Candidatus Omnitrophota bacterium]
MEKRVLGRGLAALIPEKDVETRQGSASTMQTLEPSMQQGIRNIPIDKLKTNKYQPREDFNQEALNDLAASIKEKGFIQPVLVRLKDNEYELIAGERRLRAAKKLGYKEIPAIIKEASDLDSLELSIIENIQREDLNPIDQARAYKRLQDEFDMTQEKVADTIGKDRATVANILRLLNLPVKIQEYVSRGTISMGHARAILSLTKEVEQIRLCTKVMKEDLSVRDTESYAKKIVGAGHGTTTKIEHKDPNLNSLEQELREIFGTKVKVVKAKRGGKIEIEFYSDVDMQRVITLLKSNR